MKYRHSFHAGNFADVHKHVTLLALLGALQRKDKGFLYLETHAGRGAYETGGAGEAAGGIGRLEGASPASPELRAYQAAVAAYRAATGLPHAYPGSPLLGSLSLRAQDRAVLVEQQPPEATALEIALHKTPPVARVRVERGNGFEQLRARLPPTERRGLTLIDPPYEDTAQDFIEVGAAVAEGLRRFASGCMALWYPIKDGRSVLTWQSQLARTLTVEALVSELWLYPRDSRVALNGSGLIIVNPPYQLDSRMQEWLPELHQILGPRAGSGFAVRWLGRPGPAH